MIEAPITCGKIAEPFPTKEVYYCDFCKKHPAEGTKLRWFSPHALICDDLACQVKALDAWEKHCDEQDGVPDWTFFWRLKE